MENILYGLGVTGLGMITVFVGLIILIIFITLLSAISGTKAKKAAKAPAKAQAANSVSADEVPGDVLAAIAAALAMNNESASPDVVAAISAALTVVMGGEKFVVRHVKRIHNAPAWNRAGREEQVYSRF